LQTPDPALSSLRGNMENAIISGSVGGIAQLGERLHGMQEVSGSIPLTSTTQVQGSKTGSRPLASGFV
jgi:hypothetical protein